MEVSTFLNHYGAMIGIFLRVISCGEILFFCIPLQYKEMKVLNGLKRLRLQLLAFGILLFIVNFFTIIALGNILIHHLEQNTLNVVLQIFNALAFNVMAFIGHRMYKGQYSEDSLLHHQKIDKLEKKEQKDNA